MPEIKYTGSIEVALDSRGNLQVSLDGTCRIITSLPKLVDECLRSALESGATPAEYVALKTTLREQAAEALDVIRRGGK